MRRAAASADEDGEEVAESSGVSPNQQLHMKRDRALVLFGGTRILQHTPDKHARIKTPDGGCLAYVLRTGFETAQGEYQRSLSGSQACYVSFGAVVECSCTAACWAIGCTWTLRPP